ncbi:hypothetical protein EDD16DRAFT_673721 [Pisolithus croceorrhizus]|nr:hypothetical protein F5141DRAFT_1115125 [Pisolithus sp. B1]KAI6132154.1 hypothetical protein EDD16DRAFT_673721 [Pisolithus croceorrhizus]KAI6138848.1 hypothetical protein EDD17DRAFT_374154 [Pisolithus thermaeus]
MIPFHLGWSSLAILATGLLSIYPLRATAQQTTVVCPSQYNWMDNSKSQNPCLVAAYVQGVCSGGQFSVDALQPNTHYVGPYTDQANACECNTVTYSLISACSICQNSTYIAWSSWSYNCSTVYSGYPENIPTGTAVPQWAYQDVEPTDDFNVTVAQAVGDSPESTATAAQSTVTSIPTATSTAASLTAAPSSSTTSSPQSASKSSNTGAIVGGAVGGVVGLAAIVGLAAWLLLRRRRQVTPPNALDGGAPPPATSSMYTGSNSFTAPLTQPKFYDPSDPSTFPASPPSPTIQTTPSNGYQNPSIHSALYASQGGRPGGYSGAPEL